MRNKKEGFTIIELIVVIAIIAVLASIVIAKVNQYAIKGRNVAIKENMNNLILAGNLHLENNGNFGTFCSSTALNTKNAVEKLGTGWYCLACKSDGYCEDGVKTQWCACIMEAVEDGLHKGYCVDSRGTRKERIYSGSPYTCQGYMCETGGSEGGYCK